MHAHGSARSVEILILKHCVLSIKLYDSYNPFDQFSVLLYPGSYFVTLYLPDRVLRYHLPVSFSTSLLHTLL